MSTQKHFWSETLRLAAENTLLQSNQIQQAKDYQAALAFILSDAQSSTIELAAHQRWVEGQIQLALEDTRAALQQELRDVANAQVVGNEASRNFVQQQVELVRDESRRGALEVKQMVRDHGLKAEQMEKEFAAPVLNAHDVLPQWINALVQD
ncbi:hypothetical protein DVH05_010153 [Phytophthora capsici]|nr:hypothetical protein DVH05_010153 [Phytophthora capsici]|eukprot:jgi/Phyca11/132030/e_gw1.127.14.1